jgi:ADP-heptose:LPS heptosyltransferase
VLILPCCIGDVIMATATLKALRRGYPDAHITWAVASWSKPVVENHDLLDTVLPVKSPADFVRFVSQLRAGKFDLAVSLVRSPLMSLAVRLSGIPQRVGLDSAGRGFGYNIRVPIDPNEVRHEAEIYLDVPRALGLNTDDCFTNVTVDDSLWPVLSSKLAEYHIEPPYIVINPTGGRNPGMVMDAKRWPPANFAALADGLAAQSGAQIILLGGPNDGDIIRAVQAHMTTSAAALIGELSFAEIALLANRARLYVGNDTGLTHLAAAASAPIAAIFGPSDPKRYAPFAPNAITLWKPAQVQQAGVAAGTPENWDWSRDGISVEEAEQQILAFLKH